MLTSLCSCFLSARRSGDFRILVGAGVRIFHWRWVLLSEPLHPGVRNLPPKWILRADTSWAPSAWASAGASTSCGSGLPTLRRSISVPSREDKTSLASLMEVGFLLTAARLEEGALTLPWLVICDPLWENPPKRGPH